MSPLKRLCIALLLLSACLVAGFPIASSPAAAEQPSTVLSALERNDGVYVAASRRSEVDTDAMAAVVEEADRLGYRMAVILPSEPLPELRSFVIRIQQGGEFDAVIGFGLEGEIETETGDELGSEQLGALRVVRNSSGTKEELTELFLTELTTEPEATIPPFVWRVIRWVVILLIALVVAGILEQIWRAFSKRGRRKPPTTTSGQSVGADPGVHGNASRDTSVDAPG